MEVTVAIAIARIVHVLSIVLWIGGVWFVTTIIIPSVIEKNCDAESVTMFERIEGRFSLHAKVAVLLAGLSGLYMLYANQSWALFLNTSYWWFYAMSLVWLVFMLMLFLIEPLFLHRWFASAVNRAPQSAFRRMKWMHWLLSALSLATIAGAVAGGHGWLWL